MSAISDGTLHFGVWLRNVLQTLPHKLFAALDHYGETRVHHTASRSQMRRAQHDVIRVRQAMHPRSVSAPRRTAETDPAPGQ